MTFTLHPRLEADSLFIKDLALCQLRLIKDANYPWVMLIPRRADMTEIYQLSDDLQLLLMREISIVSKAMQALTHADKMNVAALGNAVPQLHVHVIARFKNDVSFPNPVWGQVAAHPYQNGADHALISRLQEAL
jgi:diadenosine tetraphosphate (Ap4A) HIT family hydrolase